MSSKKPLKYKKDQILFEHGSLWGLVLKRDNNKYFIRTYHEVISESWFNSNSIDNDESIISLDRIEFKKVQS